MSDIGDTVAKHLTCSGDGLGHVTAGTFEGGMKGAVVGAGLVMEGISAEGTGEVGLAIVGGGAAAGGVVGLGIGFGGEVWKLPEAYMKCLTTTAKNHDSQPEKAPEISPESG